MKDLQEIQSISKLKVSATGIDGGCGYLYLNGVNAEPMAIVWSNGGDWEHVSVSYRRKTPTWDEMCRVKELFFNDDETVVQCSITRAGVSTSTFISIACICGGNVGKTQNCRRRYLCVVKL